jgi:hypothetical protein
VTPKRLPKSGIAVTVKWSYSEATAVLRELAMLPSTARRRWLRQISDYLMGWTKVAEGKGDFSITFTVREAEALCNQLGDLPKRACGPALLALHQDLVQNLPVSVLDVPPTETES